MGKDQLQHAADSLTAPLSHPMSAPSANSSVKTALRVIEIIEVFARAGKPLSLTELARELNAPVSSCLALVRTLSQLGYLYETAPRQGYYPTGRLQAMSQRIARNDPILDKVAPTLEALRHSSSETVVLGKLGSKDFVVYLEVLPSVHPICYVADPGAQRHLHCNSLGKALLSMHSPSERAKLLGKEPFKQFNEHTLTTFEALEQDIQRSNQQGWFQNLGESMPDVGGIAWPVSLLGGQYAISIAGPLYRIQPQLQNLAQQLRVACQSLSQRP